MKSCNMSITIYNENWHLDIVTTAMFYIPKITKVVHVKDHSCHSERPIRENCDWGTLQKGSGSSS